MKINIWTRAFVICCLVTSCSDNSTRSNPTRAADIPPSQVHLFEVDAVAEKFLTVYDVPGISIGVVSNLEKPFYWTKTYGIKNASTGEPVTENTVFSVASISKPVLGVLLNLAAEKGYLHLQDSIQAYLLTAELQISNPELESISFSDLARHQSGIVDPAAYDCVYYFQNELKTDFLVNLADPEVNCSNSTPTELGPYLKAYLQSNGDMHNAKANFLSESQMDTTVYSNLGAALAGYALEAAIGENLASFSKSLVFSPINMSATAWQYADLDTDDIAAGHYPTDAGIFVLPNYELITWPDGGLKSNVPDLLALMGTLLNEGATLEDDIMVLLPETIEEMLDEPEHSNFNNFWYFGWGITSDHRNYKLIGHNGAGPGFTSYMAFSREAQMGIVILLNGDDKLFPSNSLNHFGEILFGYGLSLQNNEHE